MKRKIEEECKRSTARKDEDLPRTTRSMSAREGKLEEILHGLTIDSDCDNSRSDDGDGHDKS